MRAENPGACLRGGRRAPVAEMHQRVGIVAPLGKLNSMGVPYLGAIHSIRMLRSTHGKLMPPSTAQLPQLPTRVNEGRLENAT